MRSPSCRSRSASTSKAARSRRRVSRSAGSPTSRGATVKPKRGSRERRRRGRISCARPRPCCGRRAASATTTSRSSWRGAASFAHWLRRRAGPRSRKPTSGSGKRESAMPATSYLGKPTSRVDGRAKVTGTAKYAAEYDVPGLAHGFVVSSAIAKGRITTIHTADALAVAGVLDIFTHEHRPKLASSDEAYKDEVAPPGSPLRPLYDDRILFSGQPVALVVAEEFEIARFAASLVRVEYEQEAHVTDFETQRKRAAVSKQHDTSTPKMRGNPVEAFEQAAVRINAEYRM